MQMSARLSHRCGNALIIFQRLEFATIGECAAGRASLRTSASLASCTRREDSTSLPKASRVVRSNHRGARGNPLSTRSTSPPSFTACAPGRSLARPDEARCSHGTARGVERIEGRDQARQGASSGSRFRHAEPPCWPAGLDEPPASEAPMPLVPSEDPRGLRRRSAGGAVYEERVASAGSRWAS